MRPEEYQKIRSHGEAVIRRMEIIISGAQDAAVGAAAPPAERLRPATTKDILDRRVVWLDCGDEGFEWRIPARDPVLDAEAFEDEDGCHVCRDDSYVEVEP